LQLEVSPIDAQLRAFLDADIDVVLDLLQVRRRDDRAEVRLLRG
jgi:hypothetical protein